MAVLNQVLVLFFLILIGYTAKRAKVIDDGAITHFSTFVLYITLPALILAAMQRPFSMDLLGEAGIALGLSLGIYAFAFVVALIYPNLIGLRSKERGVHRYALIFSNVGYMGYPVVEAILGPAAIFHLAIYNIPFNLFAFSIGAWIVAKDGEQRVKLSWKTFVNPAVLATLVGFVFFIGSVRFPDPLYRTLDMTGDATTPISMIVIGTILARMDVKRILGKPWNYLTILFRLVLLPAMTGVILYALGVRGLLFGLSVLITAMPVAASVSIMAEAYDGDGESASALVFVSTLLSVATIPLVALAIAGL